ncbi:MAG: nucleotidyltransferase domain-containing protein [Campylobacterota bacterium]|nr:nucleotidyltransferase domain-containing protein [Campylobacterota bacterium]
MQVRLSDEQLFTIKELAKKIFNTNSVWIFGSRANSMQKGGDIDIYIETNKTKEILQSKIEFLREFEKCYGEQKVDLIVNNGLENREIYQVARQGVKL